MAAVGQETVLSVRHWNETVFSFTTTRDPGLRFENGHFLMIGLEVEGKPLLRAYSIASANYEPALEFLSIKVSDGALTSRLQHIAPGDQLLVSRKPTGTLLLRDLRPGRRLYMLAAGTGLAPYMSIIKDPASYERFETLVLVHGVRYASELAYRDYLERELHEHEYLGELARNQLRYLPTVTREDFRNQERITRLIETGSLARETGLPPLDPKVDRVMVCGGPSMLKDTAALLDARGFEVSPGIGEAGDYVIERAFVER